MKYKKTSVVYAISILSVGLMASPALAHTGGHGASIMAGLAHPFLGLDHLLAMLAVGLWAAMRPAKMAWQGPTVFLAMIGVGALLGMSGLAYSPTYSIVEPGIMASVVLLGVMVATARHLPAGIGLAAIAGFALLHGQAHGLAAGVGFVAGMLAMTAGLHIIGYLLGKRLHQFKYGAWLAGSAIAAGGLALIMN